MNTAIITVQTLEGEIVELRPATWAEAYNQIAHYVQQCPEIRLLGFGVN